MATLPSFLRVETYFWRLRKSSSDRKYTNPFLARILRTILPLVYTSLVLVDLTFWRFRLVKMRAKPPKVKISAHLARKNVGKPCFLYTQLDFSLIFTSQDLQKLRFLCFEHNFLINSEENPVLEEVPKQSAKPSF